MEIPIALRNSMFAAAALATGLVATAPAVAQDWPQWRGPGRDGAVTSFQTPATWPDTLTERWSIEVGLGYATPLLAEDRLFMFTRQDDEEAMSALDAGSGKVVWRTSYPAPFKMNPATARHEAGPKSTPTLAGGRLFTLGITGIVTAFDAATGKQIGQRPADTVEPLFHTGQSPLVDGDQVILHVGGHDNGALTSFDTATGQVRWSWDGDGPAYGSPMVFDLAGVRQVVTFTQQFMVGVAVETGRLLWRRPFTTRANTTSQTPILFGDTVIQNGRGNGVTAFRVVQKGDEWVTEDVWHVDDVALHMTNGVVVDGVLYGLSHLNSGQYFGLDLTTGQVLWTSDPRQAENAAMAHAGDIVFSLEEDAELLVIKTNRTGLDVLKRYEVAASSTWAQPAISGNRLFIKAVSSLALLTVD